MAATGDIIKKVVDEVLEYIQKNDPECFQKLNADIPKKDEIIAEIRRVAEDEITQGEKLKLNGQDITKLGLHQDKLDAIDQGLKMVTYRGEVTPKMAKFTFTDGTEFMTIRDNPDYSWYVQMASIIIEGVMLVLSVIGLKVPISNAVLKKTTTEVVEALESSSAFTKACEKFVESWDSASGKLAQAEALFYLLKDTFSLGILWKIIKSLCSNMSTWDWIKAAALITAQLIAAFTTGGFALIAKIVLALNSAYDFYKKIKNLNEIRAVA